MSGPNCVCGADDARPDARFCKYCGEPLKLAPEQLTDAGLVETLTLLFGAVRAAVLKLRADVVLAMQGGDQRGWTRLDAGFAVVAWYQDQEERGGVHSCAIYALRGGAFALSSTLMSSRGRWQIIDAPEQLCEVLPALLMG